MKFLKRSAAIALSMCLASVIIPAALSCTAAAQAQDSRVALQRGYRTGYSDGYMAGYRDNIDSLASDYARNGEYSKADRAYSKDYGTIGDCRDGYQQGFESGYNTGFEKRSFEANLPSELKRRATVANPSATSENTSAQYNGDTTATAANSRNTDPYDPTNTAARSTIIIPRDTELLLA